MITKFEQELAPGIWLTLATIADVTAFLNEEVARWQNMSALQTRYSSLRDRTVTFQVNRLAEMASHVAQAAKTGDKARVSNVLEWFSEKNNGRALCSIIPADAVIFELAKTDPDAAIVGMSARQRETDTTQFIASNDRSDAVLSLFRYAKAVSGQPAQEQSFKIFSKLTEDTLARWKTEISTASGKMTAAQKSADARAAALDLLTKEQASKHEEMLKTHQQTLTDLEKKFFTDMTLRGPVQYWTDRASQGRRAGWWWLGGFVLAALLILSLVIWAGPDLLSLLKDKNEQISLAAVPLLLAALLPLLWVLRHIARMFADNIADARDAAQRAALTSTYLALSSQEKVNFTDDERAIIMQALFRPSPAQPTEDGVPLPLLEILKR